ncbi:DNA repair protein XRCC1 [Holothuria leucospilota]|uniref:DNA repair protein XRCC1 n=1 Tax=Holothuria leucospilota TaxID=206669 RepID=A0A9Q1CDZ1_HOLLE|nr:DNA repair protein XRCC1 [Holothuria leucospilota]
MAPIKVKEIVRFSSQDNNHPVENLLKVQTQWNRWLCAPDDRSGCLQAELQLEKADCISFIDIGNYGSSMVEIQVRRSYSSEGDFQTLLPATMFRTIKESREGLNKNGVRMFNREHFVEGVRDKQWDRIKIICRELYKKNQQFGLAFITFSSAEKRSDEQVEEKIVSREEPKMAHLKKGKISKGSNALPAWKKNASFYRQYMELTLKNNSSQSELKEKILKMSATAEDGFRHEDSFSRSAKMLLASSGGSSKSQEVMDYQVHVDTNSPEEVKDGLIQFKRKLQSFIQAEGSGIATASMKGLRAKFVEQLGYQMDEQMKKEFKTTLLKAAEKVLSSSSTPKKQAQKKKETGSSNVRNPLKEVKDSLTQFKQKLEAFIRAEGPGIATASMKGLNAKFVKQIGYKMDEQMKKEFKAATMKAAEKILSSKSSPVRTITKQAQEKDETPGSKTVDNGKAGPTKRKIFPQKRPAKARKEKEKKLPASEYRSCPRCYEKFTAGQINFHIVNCNPNHQQIARGALAAATASCDQSESPSTSSSSIITPPNPGKKKKRTGKRKSATQENQKGSGKYMKVHCDLGVSNSTVRTENQFVPRYFAKELPTPSSMSSPVNEGCDPNIVASSPGFRNDIQEEEDIVQCPICQANFPSYVIEVHASLCGVW